MTDVQEYKHPEAFCLLTYLCKDCGETEIIWNSRDGSIQVLIDCLDCKSHHMEHSLDHEDTCSPDWEPSKGDRIFVDLTKVKFQNHQLDRVKDIWNSDAYESVRLVYESPEEFVKTLRFEPNQPDLITCQNGEVPKSTDIEELTPKQVNDVLKLAVSKMKEVDIIIGVIESKIIPFLDKKSQ